MNWSYVGIWEIEVFLNSGLTSRGLLTTGDGGNKWLRQLNVFLAAAFCAIYIKVENIGDGYVQCYWCSWILVEELAADEQMQLGNTANKM